VAIIENGSWAPMAGKKMAEMLGQMKDMEIIEPMISIPSRVTGEVEQQLKELAEKL
jgi:flavorubredoxin